MSSSFSVSIHTYTIILYNIAVQNANIIIRHFAQFFLNGFLMWSRLGIFRVRVEHFDLLCYNYLIKEAFLWQ
ncbi:MAG: hypothetical protein BHW50_03360 [Ruminococcus bicirculans (ex Wegman et al. 2014)]|nr:MAG: hypothetical protein BHW50_03360 [Ruminococcus bicirculans (ex Wegman et al. 2014)]